MAVFATHVALMRDFEAVRFAPGDELPEWAKGLVGAHCLEPEADVDADPEDDGAAAEPESNGADGEEPSLTPAEAPDFTAPAPERRRGSAQK